jgi:murein DD-endopeptidase MepM/ murein hydrolase activator NlpD
MFLDHGPSPGVHRALREVTVLFWTLTSAFALTNPLPGGVSIPSGAVLTLPFPDGTPITVSCGYGPYCSAFHDGLDSTCCTNDYYALDLVRTTAGGGDGEAVTAVADGTVVYADWATGGWSTFGRIVLLEHDFGDGHAYYSLYAHLSDWSVSEGDVVSAKDQVGLMGGSGNYGDNYFGPHLHFAMYQDASYLGGPYGGHSMVPEPIDGYEDLVAGKDMDAGLWSARGPPAAA